MPVPDHMAVITSEPCPVCRQTLLKAERWRRARFLLGSFEMFAAVTAAVLLVVSGVTPTVLASVLAASAATAVSVMLFGGRRSLR